VETDSPWAERSPAQPEELVDLVVDGGRGHEGAQTVPPRDEVVALQELERLAQRHERHAEVACEPSLVGQRGAGHPLTAADTLA
jgi:hypothetical protein